MAEEEPQRKRKTSSRQSSQESLSPPGRSRSGSRSTLSSPGGSPRHLGTRKSDHRRVSAEALEQGIAAIRAHYGHKRVSVAYVQGADHTAAIVTLSRESSPIMERSRNHYSGHQSRYYSIKSASVKGRRQTAVIEQTKSSMLSSPKNNGPRTSPKTRSSSSSHGSVSSPALIDTRKEHKHRSSSGHHSHPSSKTALLSNQGSSHWDKSKASASGTEDTEYYEEVFDDSEIPRVRGRYSGRRGLEMAVAGCVVLMGTGALLVAFMWTASDSAWTIVGSTCMSLGGLCLVLGICWYLSKTRDPQEERIEIRVVDAKQMARLIKQGFRVKPVDAV